MSPRPPVCSLLCRIGILGPTRPKPSPIACDLSAAHKSTQKPKWTSQGTVRFSKSSCQLPPRLDTQLSESWRLAWRLVVTSDTGLRQFRFLYYRSVKSIVSTQIISQVNSSPSTFHPPQLHTCTNLLGRLPPREGSLLWFNTFVLSLGSIAFHSIHLKKRILNFNFSIYMLHETWGNRNARSGEGKHSKKGRLSALPS